MTVERSRRALIAAACTISACLVFLATSRGVGLSPDSLQYFAASASVHGGNGLTTIGWDGVPTPLAHYPPGYPLLLATGAWLGRSLEETARYLNIILFASTLVLVAALARRIAPNPPWAVPAAAFAAAVCNDLLVVHSMAWSEPLYLTLTLAGLLALAVAIDCFSLRLLVLAAAAAAASSIVRYVGVANIAVVAIVTLCCWRGTKRKRLGITALVSVPMLVPLIATVFLGAKADGVVANRRFLWHPVELTDLRIGASAVTKWVTPLSDANVFTAAWLLILAALLVAILMNRPRMQRRDLTPQGKMVRGIASLYAVVYSAVVALSMTVVDAQTTFEPRLLVPLLAVFLLLATTWLARESRDGGVVRFASAGVFILLFIANVFRWWPWFGDARRDGLALRRVAPGDSSLVASAQRLPANAMIYSNDPFYLRVQMRRVVAGLPRTRDPNSLVPNEHHAEQVRSICTTAGTRPTFIVLLDDSISGDSTARADEAIQTGEITRLAAGSIVRVRAGCEA